MRSRRVLFLVEMAIFSAIAVLLDIIPFLSFKLWAQGGSVSFSMVPVLIMAFRWGLKGGLTSGFLLGLYQILLGNAFLVTPVQTFLDYIVAFTLIGLAGLTSAQVAAAAHKNRVKRMVTGIIIGCFIGSLFRFLSHFTAGIVFYGNFAPPGQPVWLYSLIYNGGYMLPDFILSAVLVGLLFVNRPMLVQRK
ncbi:energy-coupled thiamine transporter ThiT [Halobacillus salinarum]|uniref:Energy-coupled thiamine transporter ThiT n=2 Tax=Halobacillus salinarum TaxID=2932257 RepID=A0ABY4ERZ9_9BACI|nr:energy-coupled thiamine transporter ThiT [Halobacillus salinarum]